MNLNDNVMKSKRPNLSPFHQQKLKACTPSISTFNLYPALLIIGLSFILIGTALVFYTYQVIEISVNYTNCIDTGGQKCSDQLSRNNFTGSYQSCSCSLNVTIPEPINGPVFIYYGLTRVFQNYRRYVKSRDENQLQGRAVTHKLNSNCEPFRYSNVRNKIGFAPCGAIANSLFNDTFNLDYTSENGTTVTVPWTMEGIAWPSDRFITFGQPKNWDNTVRPLNWRHTAKERSVTAYQGDEELLVWLRTSPFPTFKKLHRIIRSSPPPFKKGLPRGRYRLKINYSYPVTLFGGTKSFVISNTNLLGGKNPSMGYIYMITGSIYISIGVAFLFVNSIVNRRRLNTSQYIEILSSNNVDCSEMHSRTRDGDGSYSVDQCTSDVTAIVT